MNAETLIAAENKLAELKSAADKAAADKAAADAVQKLIDAIGKVTLESEKEILADRKAYNALTEEQKALVDVSALVSAEKEIASLQKDPENPQTGDTVPLGLVAAVMVMSVTALALLAVLEIRRRKASRK